jgi:head-tail adaptor
MGVGTMKMIKLVEIVQSQSAQGRNSETEGNNYPLWAEIKRRTAGFVYKSGLVNLTESLEFRVRYRDDIKPDSKFKVLYLGNRHQVKSITRENESKFFWIIIADAQHS